ncbi:MAG TPA: CsbD family protein [Vicinamibacterales bacterium]|nr:CsbD family protein [Vicinamibacterales bacterium]
MDANILKGKWLQLKGSIREKWGQLTDDDVDTVEGSAERLVGKIQERYGYAKQRAEDEVDAFLARYGTTTP